MRRGVLNVFTVQLAVLDSAFHVVRRCHVPAQEIQVPTT